MNYLKRILVVIFALAFGVFFTAAVSFMTTYHAERTVLAGVSSESSEIEAQGVTDIQLTAELGKLRLVESASDQITVECQYPAEGYLDNQLKVTADHDGEELNIRIGSKQKVYFFGLVKDKACDIIIGIPKGLNPKLHVKLQAGTLTVEQPELKELSVDGDVAEVEIQGFSGEMPEQVILSNNVGNITAYLDNLPEKTLKSFQASVNIGVVDLHLRTDDTRGYQVDYAYSIGSFERKGERDAGIAGGATVTVGAEQQAVYRVKTDIGEIRVSEDKETQGLAVW